MKAPMGPVLTLGFFSVLLLAHDVAATQFPVGGSSGWSVPPGNNSIHNDWAERMRFQVGDSLLFVYDSSKDSVLRVTKDDYASCNTGSPLEKHTDGHTVFTLSQSGPYYFISGNKGNCLRNEKLVVVVLADRRMASLAPSPAPLAPSPLAPPTPSPAETPSSPPSVVEAPTSSPPSPVETPAGSPPPEVPSTPSSPPRNNAGSIARGVLGSVGTLLGSAMLLGVV